MELPDTCSRWIEGGCSNLVVVEKAFSLTTRLLVKWRSIARSGQKPCAAESRLCVLQDSGNCGQRVPITCRCRDAEDLVELAISAVIELTTQRDYFRVAAIREHTPQSKNRFSQANAHF